RLKILKNTRWTKLWFSAQPTFRVVFPSVKLGKANSAGLKHCPPSPTAGCGTGIALVRRLGCSAARPLMAIANLPDECADAEAGSLHVRLHWGVNGCRC